MLLYELVIQLPRGIPDDLIHVSTMPHGVVSLEIRHNGPAFLLVGQIVVADWK